MKCGYMRHVEAYDRSRAASNDPVTVEGKVLYVGEKAVKLWTPIGDEWIPLSQILESDPEIDELEEGDEATLIIPRWLAREKGLGE